MIILQMKVESVQYNVALAITGAIRGSSRERLYQEIGLESIHDRWRWYRKHCFYYKIRHNLCTRYLIDLLPAEASSCYRLRSNQLTKIPYTRTDRFKSTFVPSSILSCNQLDPEIQNSSSIEIFKRALLKFIRPKPTS